MTGQAVETAYVDAGPVPFTRADRDYVLGAYAERRDAAATRGEVYLLTDFVHDALIEAAHQ